MADQEDGPPEGGRRRARRSGNRVAPDEAGGEVEGEAKPKARRSRRQQRDAPQDKAAPDDGGPINGEDGGEGGSQDAEKDDRGNGQDAEINDRGDGDDGGGQEDRAPADSRQVATQRNARSSTIDKLGVLGGDGGEEVWDLCLTVDPVTDNEEHAKKEVEELFKLLSKEGLTLTNPHPLDPKAGFTGQVFALCTASQEELEQEAEIMGLNKPLKLSLAAQRKFNKSQAYGRVTAPFTVARRAQFHRVPYLQGDEVVSEEEDKSGLVFFSACERQNLLEHMIEQKIRQAVKDKKMAPKTEVKFFPLHDADGEGSRDLIWLRQHWAKLLRWERLTSVLKIWQNPHSGLNEPIAEVRDYFGDQIAIYFAFLSFYTRWLSYPAVVGLIFQIWTFVSGSSDVGLVAYCVFICVWSVLMIKFWERKQNALAYYWFTSDLALEEKVRREFYIAIDAVDNRPTQSVSGAGFGRASAGGGDDDFTGVSQMSEMPLNISNVRKLNKKTGQVEEKYPKYRRMLKYLCMLSTVLVLLTGVVMSFIYFYLINIIAEYWDCNYGEVAGSIVHASCIVGMGQLYRGLAGVFNDWETHRTDVKYENHLIAKVFLFEFCNNFLSMFWITFLAIYLCAELEEVASTLGARPAHAMAEQAPSCLEGKYGSASQCSRRFRDSVMDELAGKLSSLLGVRMVVGNVTEVAVPMAMTMLRARQQAKKDADDEADGSVAAEDDFKAEEDADKDQGGAGSASVGGDEEERVLDPHEGVEGAGGNKASDEPATVADGNKEAGGKRRARRGGANKGKGKDTEVQDGDAHVVSGENMGQAAGWESRKQAVAASRSSLGMRGAGCSETHGSLALADGPCSVVVHGGAMGGGGVGDELAATFGLSSAGKKLDDLPAKSRAWWVHKGRQEQIMQEYGGGGDACTVDDYQELVIQFCFVTLFGAAFPLSALLALASNLLEVWVDAYKLCHTMQRPLAQRAAGIPGTWLMILKIMAVLSVLTNIIIVFENSQSLCDFMGVDIESETKWLVAFVFEHIIIIIVIIFFALVPIESKGITKLKNLSRTIKNFTLSSADREERTGAGGGAAAVAEGVLKTSQVGGKGDKSALAADAAAKRQQAAASRGVPKAS